MLERGERIELLVQSTDNLQTQAFSFKRDAGRLQRSMWWKNVRAQVYSRSIKHQSFMMTQAKPSVQRCIKQLTCSTMLQCVHSMGF